MQKQDIENIRDAILEAVLPDVAFDGWCWDSLCLAAQECGYDEESVRAVFPENMKDVLRHFSDYADRQMLEALGDVDPADLRVRDRIREAVLARFHVLQPHKDAVRQSVQFWIWPTRKPSAAKMVWRTADRIWQWAGDDAKDYNHYTKRALLSGVLTATTVAWFDDNSDDMCVTRSFLDRRIDNVLQFGKVISRFKARPA